MKTLLIQISIFFFLAPIHGYGMDVKEVIEKMQQVYKQSHEFSYHSRYELFKGHKSNEAIENYTGFFGRKGASSYQKIGNSEQVYGKDFSLLINHDEQAMMLSNPQSIMTLPADLKQALSHCKESKLEEKDDAYIIVLYLKQTSPIPYSLVKLKIAKTGYHLQQLDLYYSVATDFSQDHRIQDFEYAHLRIKLENFKKDCRLKESVFDVNTYLKKKNNAWFPVGDLEGYDIIDNRDK